MKTTTALLAAFSVFFMLGCSSGEIKKRNIPEEKKVVIIVNDILNDTGDKAMDAVALKSSAKFSSALQETGLFKLVERKRLRDVMKELEFNMTGLVDPDKVKQVGKMVGADAILFIEINDITFIDNDRDVGLFISKKEGVTARISAKLVDTQTSQILANVSEKYENTNTINYVSSDVTVGTRMDKYEMAGSLLQENAEIFAEKLAQSASDLVAN